MARKYFDKNGRKIVAGMTLRHDDGTLEKVYASDNDDLGFNATRENSAVFRWMELYPLSEFSLNEYEIVEVEENENK